MGEEFINVYSDCEELESTTPLLNGTDVTQLQVIFAFQEYMATVVRFLKHFERNVNSECYVKIYCFPKQILTQNLKTNQLKQN